MENAPINLQRLKEMIKKGVEAIPIDNTSESAVLMIGDTGVGKSTIMSFLSGAQLTVRLDGLKPSLDNREGGLIKIGHQKFSQTSVPTKIVIQNMAFYDCPGFKDNKGQQYEISNSFFIQRLLDIYKKVKLVLVIDQTHISETRADKFPKLVRSLQKAFKTFADIRDGVFLIINRADKDQPYASYMREIQKMIEMKGQKNYLFDQQQRQFVKFLLTNQRVFLFRSPDKQDKDKPFVAPAEQRTLLMRIHNLNFVKSRHIQNILSESARLSIRDFIDEITKKSNFKIQLICTEIVNGYAAKIVSAGRNLNQILRLKEGVIDLAQNIKGAQAQGIVSILQKQVPAQKMQDFEEDYVSVLFFKGIYDKTASYFSNLVNKIYSELTHLLHKFDKRILVIQKQNAEELQKQKLIEIKKQKQKQRQKQKKVIDVDVLKMDDIRLRAHNLVSSASGLREQLLKALEYTKNIHNEFQQVKQGAAHLRAFDNQLKEVFVKVQKAYFSSSSTRQQNQRAY